MLMRNEMSEHEHKGQFADNSAAMLEGCNTYRKFADDTAAMLAATLITTPRHFMEI